MNLPNAKGNEEQRAALDALRGAIVRLLELSYHALPEERRALADQLLDQGQLEVAAMMKPLRLDVRFDLVSGAARVNLLTADAEYREGDHALN